MERHGEHVDAATAKKEDSHMWVHARDEHEGQVKYQIQPLKTHKSSMMRQISETVEIKLRSRDGVHLLNNKMEYNRCLLPELGVVLGKNKLTEVNEDDKEDKFF